MAPLVTVIRTPEIAAVESAGEVPRYHGFQRWQARAEDTDVDFERRPDCRQRVVPGYVCVVQEDQQGLQAQDRDDASEASECEDDHQRYALTFGKLELVEEGQREDGDEDVGHYVYAGVGEPEY